MAGKTIYRFRQGQAEGEAASKSVLGGKGANLAEMANMGVPVPPGFTISAGVCVEYMRTNTVPAGLIADVHTAMAWLEKTTGRRFGAGSPPLLVSVRSGARSSMPGMMDTVLDLGLNEESLRELAAQSGSRRFALDAYRRFLSMFGDVVLGVPHARFEDALDHARREYAQRKGIALPQDREAVARRIPDSLLDAEALELLVVTLQRLIAEGSGAPVPSDPYAQLEAAIVAVFKSWNNQRARVYRAMHRIPDHWGTAVNVQAMVFGNLGDDSATGVAFTRDPSTGERRFFGEWLQNAQGEDVVAGIRTPRPLKRVPDQPGNSLEEAMPDCFQELNEIQSQLERHFRDMQDLEFTIEQGKLYLLQTRDGKRSARAAARIAVDMVDEGLLRRDEAILRMDASRVHELLFPAIDPSAQATPLTSGLPAAPGAVTGQIVLHANEAEAWAQENKAVILVRTETSPEDLHGMRAARGILTARGGATSHAAVVARGMGRPCIVGCSSLSVDEGAGTVEVHGPDGTVVANLRRGDTITLDGATGQVFAGTVATVPADLGTPMRRLLGWCQSVQRMAVRANADTPEQAQQAIDLGADGIGLCRTEHMFFAEDRILAMREMILSRTLEERRRALDKLLPFQVEDFLAMFRAMRGRPMTIRLLDPPLHEFLPREPAQHDELARDLGISAAEVRRRGRELEEQNPMLGHRGVRLAITFPEIVEMQVRAIFSAACAVQREGVHVEPEVMIPLCFSREELALMHKLVDRTAQEIFQEQGITLGYRFGTMIELPRAALLAAELAREAEFFSFGTNDLTQTTLGLSRDDTGTFLPAYLSAGILPHDPFVTLDEAGVGQLVELGVQRGRQTRPDLICGMCGEHGGDPSSVALADRMELTYVSCSPFRVPIARLSAAQATLRRHP